ncbi:MAG: hypothetical protein GFH27_549323n3 [Chloroflexi bacterium AL-W]|nr:hypothetical protein [Chloroflexi bacterium AL-N1]NOK70154.1 hypothetical protein [Chloroflexi bacterium AL-N10]NOK77691.1 hypothetical protein [Chloroflexi bacterium AL-N5]NOK84700.1 hypothetical protein [Chloroflexi bacterium AL-W]NOK93237.1 hypothetical protein [Chloroflexi bacterium AL-N15]
MNKPTATESELLEQLLQNTQTSNTSNHSTQASVPPQPVIVVQQPTQASAQGKSNNTQKTAPTPVPVELDTGVLEKEHIRFVARWALRILALIGVLTTAFGSVISVNGGWEPSWAFWQGIHPAAWVLGLIIQFIIVLVQWSSEIKSVWYIASTIVDSALTFWGYWNVFDDILVERFIYVIPTMVVFGIVCILVSVYPEQVMVIRRRKV